MDAEQKRQSDLLIGELIGKFEAFYAQQVQRDKIQERRDCEAQAWREKFDQRLKPLETLVDRLDTPMKAALWALGLVATAILTGMGVALWRWLERHWQ